MLKPLIFAGLLIEGGIIGYDANVASGGDGARYFGIGIHEEYRIDQVTVSMRIDSGADGRGVADRGSHQDHSQPQDGHGRVQIPGHEHESV